MDNETTQLRQRQKEWVNTLHGKTPIETNNVFWKLLNKDSSMQTETIDNYMNKWSNDKKSEDKRLDEYNETTFHYYNLVTDFYEYGWGQSFHFCKFFLGDKFTEAIKRHEHYLANQCGIQAGDLVLDVGCGVGGPAREIVKFTGCHLIGLNNNDYQIGRANLYAKREGLEQQCQFVKGDFMNLEGQFPEGSFDKVYAIEATVHAPELYGVYSQIYKVLKPGGRFAVYEWVMTDKYDPENPEHQQIAYNIEIGDGIPKMYKREVAEEALKRSGFNILVQHDLADVNDPIPWYYPLTGDWKYIQTLNDYLTFARTSYLGRKFTSMMISSLEYLHVIPSGSSKVTDALENAAVGLVAGGKQGLFTPMMLFVAEKPLEE